jgi:hypothetical protein
MQTEAVGLFCVTINRGKEIEKKTKWAEHILLIEVVRTLDFVIVARIPSEKGEYSRESRVRWSIVKDTADLE